MTMNDALSSSNKKRKHRKEESWREKKRRKREKNNAKIIAILEEEKQKRNNSNAEATIIDQIRLDEEIVDPLQHASKLATFKAKPTLTIAIPGSIISNAQSFELRTYLAGSIARAAAVFCVDEVVVFDETAQLTDEQLSAYSRNERVVLTSGKDTQSKSKTEPNIFLARILQYLESPQYLRKRLFPISVDYKYVGLLNPLDCPHHMRADDFRLPFREAVVVRKECRDDNCSFADAGLKADVKIDRKLTPGVRVTLRATQHDLTKKHPRATVVSCQQPRRELGIFWGYQVRVAKSLSAVFNQCSYPGGYDYKVGTSDKGCPIENVPNERFKEARHILLVLGGVAGLEAALESDESLTTSVDRIDSLFDDYVNTCSAQGSRTIRTEEALLISLSAIRIKLNLTD